MFGLKHSEETKRKIREKLNGHKRTIESKLKQGLTNKTIGVGKWNKGRVGWFKGKHHTEEEKRNQSLKMKGKFAKEKHPNWLGGKSFELYTIDWNDVLRESIRIRDNYMCQVCGINQDELDGFYKLLDIHHINYDKKNCNPENLITLCRSCHTKTNVNRNYWIKYFEKQ